MNNELVTQMQEYMDKNGLKRFELANKLNTTPSNITRWMSGKKISPAWAKLIRQELGIE